MGRFSRAPGMEKFPALIAAMATGTDGNQDFYLGGVYGLGAALDLAPSSYCRVVAKTLVGENAIYKIDLGKTFLVDHVRAKIGVWADNNFGTAVGVDVDIDISDDDVNWYEIDTFTDTTTLKNSVSAEVQDTAVINTGTVLARYVRIEFAISVTAGTDNELRVYELNVIGYPITEVPAI